LDWESTTILSGKPREPVWEVRIFSLLVTALATWMSPHTDPVCYLTVLAVPNVMGPLRLEVCNTAKTVLARFSDLRLYELTILGVR
jgi:hypothetical protein